MLLSSLMRRKSHGHDETGASAVEFALVLPLLVLLVLGTIEFGRLLNVYIEVTHIAREGARQASVGKYGEWAAAPAVPAYLASGIAISGSDSAPAGAPVSVTVSYTFPTALVIPHIGGSSISLPISVQSTATMRRE